jgi:hypothetical protein
MSIPILDCRNNWRLLDELLEQESNPNKQHMLSQIKLHMQTETGGDLAALMDTVTTEPIYHQWAADGSESGPKTRADLEEFYTGLIASGANQFEYDIERVVVGEDCVVTEGDIRIPFAGSMLKSMGQDVDEEGRYATSGRCVTFWPFDADGKIIGEDIYTMGGFDFEKTTKVEVTDYRYEG